MPFGFDLHHHLSTKIKIFAQQHKIQLAHLEAEKFQEYDNQTTRERVPFTGRIQCRKDGPTIWDRPILVQPILEHSPSYSHKSKFSQILITLLIPDGY